MNDHAKMDSVLFEEILREMEVKVNAIHSLFHTMDKEMSSINGESSTWYGDAQATLYRQYCAVSKKFSSIDDKLDNYLSFLRTTLDNYERRNEALNRSVSENQEDLDVR